MNRFLLILLSSEETSSTWELGQRKTGWKDKDKSAALKRGYNVTNAGAANWLTDCGVHGL